MLDRLNEIIELDEGWYIARCSEVPGANGQGRTLVECRDSLKAAIELIREDSTPANWDNPL